jgi:chitin disaccharide deacetylase
MKVILNADDFGSTERHSRLIVDLLEKGKISSTTFLVNLPYSAEAASILRSRSMALTGKIGLHFNLTEGKPLNPMLMNSPFVDQNGDLKDFRGRIGFFQQLFHLRKLRKELDLQIERFHTLVGKYPTHIDSHGHTHCTVVMLLALLTSRQAKKITAIRLTRQYDHEPQYLTGIKNRVRRLAKKLLNAAFRLRFRTADYFTDIRNIDQRWLQKEDVERMKHLFNVVEIMCHPFYFDESEYEFLNAEPNLLEQIPDLELIGYSDL